MHDHAGWVVASVSAPNMRPELAVTRLSSSSSSKAAGASSSGAAPAAWQPFGPAYEDDDAQGNGPPFGQAAAQQNGGMPASLGSMECRTLQV